MSFPDGLIQNALRASPGAVPLSRPCSSRPTSRFGRVGVMELIPALVGSGFVGALVGALLTRYLAPGTARRIRRDREREEALAVVVDNCAVLERHLDLMLSPDKSTAEGV